VIRDAVERAQAAGVVPASTAARVVAALRAAGYEIVDVSDETHQIEFRDDGWTIIHPIKERLDGSLFDCRARWNAAEPGVRGRRELRYSEALGDWAIVGRVGEAKS